MIFRLCAFCVVDPKWPQKCFSLLLRIADSCGVAHGEAARHERAPLREIDSRALAPVAAVVVQWDPDVGQERELPTWLGRTRLSIEDVRPN